MGTIGRYISVIASWMLTLTSFLEVLCKIVALPDPIAKTLFGIFLMVSLLLSVHFFVYLMKMDAPNVKIPNKVNDYLNCIEKVERRNKSLHVISEKFDVNLIKAGNDVANQVAVRQRIQWTIRLANVDVATVVHDVAQIIFLHIVHEGGAVHLQHPVTEKCLITGQRLTKVLRHGDALSGVDRKKLHLDRRGIRVAFHLNAVGVAFIGAG